MLTIDPTIADMPIMAALMEILKQVLPGASPFECLNKAPTGDAEHMIELQREELREVFKVFYLTNIPETMTFAEGITAFKVPLKFVEKMPRNTMYAPALFYAIDSIRYVYFESNPGEVYKKQSELLGLRDILYVRNCHAQFKAKLDDVKFEFEKWSGETATWFMFMLSVTSQVESKGLPQLLRYDPNNRDSNIQLKALESADAVFYNALYSAIHSHSGCKVGKLDIFLESRWTNSRKLRGSVVWAALYEMFETARASDERLQIHNEYISNNALKKSDQIHLDSVAATNVSSLLSLVPLLKEIPGNVTDTQVQALLDQYDSQALRNHSGSITTPGEFRKYRAEIGGLQKNKKFYVPNPEKPATVLSGIQVRRTTSRGEDSTKDWPLGHKAVPESSHTKKKKTLETGGKQKDPKSVSFAEKGVHKATKGSGNDPKSDVPTPKGKVTRKPGLRVDPAVYKLCSAEEKSLLRQGKRPETIDKYEKVAKVATGQGGSQKKNNSSKVGQTDSAPKGKKRQLEDKTKKKSVPTKRSKKQYAAARRAKGAQISEEKDNNDFS